MSQVMGRANDDTEASGHPAPSSTIPQQYQTPLEDNGLPPYTDAVAGSPVARGAAFSNAMHNSSQLCQPDGTTPSTVISSTRGSTRVSLSSTVASDPKLLQSFVKSETRRMPNPLVRLIGTHTERRPRDRGTNETTARDFDIQISMADLLVPAWRRTRLAENRDKVYRGGRLKSIATGYNSTDAFTRDSTPSLQEWCHLFCASSARLKSYGSTPLTCTCITGHDANKISPVRFTITREVTNLDDKYLVHALQGVLRSTNYRGDISIAFPLDDREISLMSDHWINRCRTNMFIWWTCVVLQLWIITWPVIWMMTKKWEVVKIIWPCRVHRDEDVDVAWPNAEEESAELIDESIYLNDGSPTSRGQDNVRFATIAEPTWVEIWRGSIARAAIDRRNGVLLGPLDLEATRAAEEINARRASQRELGYGESSRGLGPFLSGMREFYGEQGWGGDTYD